MRGEIGRNGSARRLRSHDRRVFEQPLAEFDHHDLAAVAFGVTVMLILNRITAADPAYEWRELAGVRLWTSHPCD